MPHFKRLASALAAVAVVGGGAVVAAAPANAAVSDCPSGYSCLWQGIKYPGAPNARFESSVSLGTSSNKINSIANRGRSSYARYWDGNFSGGSIYLANPARSSEQNADPFLENGTTSRPGENWANRISSAQFV